MNTNYEDLSSALIKSIDLISQKITDKDERTLTVEAKVIEVIDKGKGIYKVQYLNNEFEVTNSNIENIYNINDVVYVLIPNGNFDNNKVIISSVHSASNNYLSTEDENLYIHLTGDLMATEDNEFKLNSYNKEEISRFLSNTFKEYFLNSLNESRDFELKCKIRTEIDSLRQAGGNYGLILQLPCNENDYKDFVLIDKYNLTGNIYNYKDYSLQDVTFNIPENFVIDESRAIKLIAFVEDFDPYNAPSAQDYADIFIKDIEFYSVQIIENKKEENKGYYLTINSTNGKTFVQSEGSKVLTPNLLLNGLSTDYSTFDCYWFKENYLININNSNYHYLGGIGWEILNDKIKSEVRIGGDDDNQYITNNYQYTIYKEDIPLSTRFKCILIKDKTVVENIITIDNTNDNIDFQLRPKNDTAVYTKDVGRVELVIDYFEQGLTNINSPSESIKYAWQVFDKKGNLIRDNFIVQDKLNEKVLIDSKQYYESEFSYAVSEIDEVNSVYCTVYKVNNQNKEIVMATSSIVVQTQKPASYRILADGYAEYNYDKDGDSPFTEDYDGEIKKEENLIKPISIKLYKENGMEFSSDEYAVTTVEWLIPIQSMIKVNSEDETTNKGYYTIIGPYNSYSQLNYTIANKYNETKNENNIIVKTCFKGESCEEVVNIVFLKDGNNETNGLKYSGAIKCNGYRYNEEDEEGRIRKLHLICKYNSNTNHKWFIWEDGIQENNIIPIEPRININEINFSVECFVNGHSIEGGNEPLVLWSIFEDGYNYDNIISPLDITSGGKLSLKEDIKVELENGEPISNFCTMIQAKIKIEGDTSINAEEYCYAYYPVEIIITRDEDLVGLLRPHLSGGYCQVIYAEDGTNPQYNSSNDFQYVDEYFNYIENDNDYVHQSPVWDSNLLDNVIYSFSAEIAPPAKFDNGLNEKYVKFKVGIKEASQGLIREINKLEEEKEKVDKQAQYYNSLMTSKDLFNLDIDNIINDTSLNSRLYSFKTEFINIIDGLILNLNNLIEIIDDESSTTQISQKINILNDLISKIKTLGTVNDGFQLIDYILNNGKIDGLIIDSSIDLLKYNDILISSYKKYYNDLNDNKVDYNTLNAECYIKIYNVLENFLDNPAWQNVYLQAGDQFYLFNSAYQTLNSYFSSFVEQKSFNDIKYNVLTKIKIDLNSLYNIDYISKIVEYETLKLEYERKENFLKEIQNQSSAFFRFHFMFYIFKPIAILLDRTGKTNINGWDGNKLKISGYSSSYSTSSVYNSEEFLTVSRELEELRGDGDTNQETKDYISNLQLGAGIYNETDGFTGMVMGVEQEVVSGEENDEFTSNHKIGLLGYSKGKESLYLNAKDGSAIFGIKNTGRIIVDPTHGSLLYSEKYWKEYNYDGKPSSYDDSNIGNPENGPALLIDLSEPCMKFNNGAFEVDKTGHLTAVGGGHIGGWKIGTKTLESLNLENGLVLDSGTKAEYDSNTHQYNFSTESEGKIYTRKHNELTSIGEGFYISNDGLSIHNNIRINGSSILLGDLTPNNGKYWTIKGNEDNAFIGYNTESFHDAINNPGSSNQVYLGTNGIYLGSNFSVNSNGALKSKNGTIGGWTINATTLTGGQVKLNSEGSISGPEGKWNIDKNGRATFTDIVITGNGASTLGTSGSSMNWGEKFSVDTQGNLKANDAYFNNSYIEGTIKANSGHIGGITISRSGLSAANFSLTSAGLLSAKDATFSGDINATGLKITNGGNGFIDFGSGTEHLLVSGLNIENSGINMNGHSISKAREIVGSTKQYITFNNETTQTTIVGTPLSLTSDSNINLTAGTGVSISGGITIDGLKIKDVGAGKSGYIDVRCANGDTARLVFSYGVCTSGLPNT